MELSRKLSLIGEHCIIYVGVEVQTSVIPLIYLKDGISSH
jgi:hypothetical protein